METYPQSRHSRCRLKSPRQEIDGAKIARPKDTLDTIRVAVLWLHQVASGLDPIRFVLDVQEHFCARVREGHSMPLERLSLVRIR